VYLQGLAKRSRGPDIVRVELGIEIELRNPNLNLIGRLILFLLLLRESNKVRRIMN